jgi:NADPH:quinone reductase-like Zn-dependent oxidoreductase
MRLLIVGTLKGELITAAKIARERGAQVAQVDGIEAALTHMRAGRGADLLMVDVHLDIRKLADAMDGERINSPIVACGTGADAQAAVAAIRAGAKEYIPLPPDPELIAAVLEAVAREKSDFVFRDPSMDRVVKLALQVAASEASILITGAAGGVGSILIQLARHLTALTVIATASRPESVEWCRSLGAHHVVDHSGDLAAQIDRLGAAPVTYVASLTRTDQHFRSLAEIVAPQGRIALIDDPGLIDIRLLKQKSLSLHWEFMFTRPSMQTPDMIRQHELLEDVANLVDAGRLRTTLRKLIAPISAANLILAHQHLESGTANGKIVLEGFI